ncbi:MAG: hypothetical protein IKZ45_07280 [Fibrobacter sp.]|nr:hypothetical protein [Fibrobacter sp.]
MDIVAKITMVASIILMGYSASQVVTSYAALCEKADAFRDLARENDSQEIDLRRSNLALSLALAIGYVLLVYFSGLLPWISVVIALKLALTLFISDREICMVVRGTELKKTYFWLDKADSFVNVILGLLVAISLVL